MIFYSLEKEVLKAQKRSLAAWINNTLGATVVDAENLIPQLSTGAVLCQLAKCIQSKVDQNDQHPMKEDGMRWWSGAQRESFFARDNAATFLHWCRRLGVREALLFESEGLVLERSERTVLLCLLEVSRLASRYGLLLPPPLQVALSSDIGVTILQPSSDIGASCPVASPDSGIGSESVGRSPSPPVLPKSRIPRFKRSAEIAVCSPSPSLLSHTVSSRMRSRPEPRSWPQLDADGVPKMPEARRASIQQRDCLHNRVCEIARQYHQDVNKIHRLAEGRYSLCGKRVHLKLVRGSRVVVRVGGGWDTLEHFLLSLDRRRPMVKHRNSGFLTY